MLFIYFSYILNMFFLSNPFVRNSSFYNISNTTHSYQREKKIVSFEFLRIKWKIFIKEETIRNQ